jgi:O-antigen/teichoic acid export membrane protein
MKKSVAWNTIGNFIYMLCQWAMTVLVVRLGNYQSAGYLNLAMTTSSTFSAISLFSMRNFQVSDVNREYSNSEYMCSRVISCLLSIAACFIFAVFCIEGRYQRECIMAFMLIRVAEAMIDVLHGEDQFCNRYDVIGKSFIFRGVATLVVFGLIMYLHRDVLLALIFVAVQSFAFFVLWDWTNTKKCSSGLAFIRPGPKVWKLMGTCIPIVIFTLMLNSINLIPKNVLQDVCGNHILGIYTSMASPTLAVQVFAQVIFVPFIPAISVKIEAGDGEGVSRILKKVYLALAVLAVVSMAGGLLIGRAGLSLLFGSSILKYYSRFPLIIMCTILLAVIWILYAIAVAFRKIKEILAGMSVTFILLLIITRPLTVHFGMNGTSLAQVIAYSFFIPQLVLLCSKASRHIMR